MRPPGVSRVLYALLLVFLLVCVPLHAQVSQNPNLNSTRTVRGQIMLPGGDLPENPIRFEVSSADGTYHDVRFTDSNGRFVIPGLLLGMEYTLFVRSDEATWASTSLIFIPQVADTLRFYLNPYKPPKAAKPATVSAATRNKPDPQVLEMRQKALQVFDQGHSDQARQMLVEVTQLAPHYADAFNDLGVIEMRASEYAAAEKNFRHGLELDPKSPELQANLGEVLDHQKRFADAIAPLEESVRLKPDAPQVHFLLGVALVETDDLANGRRELELAQSQFGEQASKDALLQLYLGDAYARIGLYVKAIRALNAYLLLAPHASNAASVQAAIERMQKVVAAHDAQIRP
jgi:tetratricopeptide (TPR) repeat protein